MTAVIALHTDLPLPDGVVATVDQGRDLLVATADGDVVGYVVWRVDTDLATVDAVASLAGADHDVAILDALRARAAGSGVTKMVAEIGEDQQALHAALQGATVLSTFMVKPVPASAPSFPPGFAARPMSDDEYAEWKRTGVEEYAAENLARSGGDLELARQRSLESYVRLLPDDAATPDTRLLTLTLDGERAGDLWIRHHWPRYRDAHPADDLTFTFDIQVSQRFRGRGLGRAAMLAVELHALEVGDRQLGLNVFGGNDVAIGLYRSLGYRPVSSVVEVGPPQV